MSNTTQFVVLFIGAVSLLFALGFFAIWAEFKSSAKKHEYTRYVHRKVATAVEWPMKAFPIVDKADKWVKFGNSYAYVHVL